jgi:hypothetical protein
MNATNRGGYVPSGGGPFDPSPAYCERPTFKIATTTSAAATSEIRITDGTTTFKVIIRSLRTVRRFVIADALRQGADAHLVWSVASDVRGPEAKGPARSPDHGKGFYGDWPAHGKGFYADWSPDHGKGFYFWVPSAPPKGSTVILPVPSDAAPGPGKLSIGAHFEPGVAGCEGIARCDGALMGGQRLEVTIVPASADW